MTAPDPTPPPRPGRHDEGPRRGSIAAGIFLVVLGVAFLVARVLHLEYGLGTWPVWIVVPGIALFIGGLVVGGPGGLGMTIPGAIVTTVGLILWIQDATGLWATWAYAWALVAPTSVGFAMLVYGLVHGDRELRRNGLRTFLVGIALFAGFALFFEGAIGLSGGRIPAADILLPVVAIGIGVVFLALSVMRRPTTR
jgi:hypothetical protein